MKYLKISILSLLLYTVTAVAQTSVNYSAELFANVSTGTFMPSLLASNNDGKVFMGNGVWHSGRADKLLNPNDKFSWGSGVEYIVGIGNTASYDKYEAASGSWDTNKVRQSSARLISLYGEVKYRSLHALVGMKPQNSKIVDSKISTGDLVRSRNSTPIPGISVGFIDFQDIPFTNGWVQIDGEIMYGRLFDNKSKENRFNYYNGVLTKNLCYTYKRCYFRTKPTQPFSIIVGMQAAGIFGGSSQWWKNGILTNSQERGFKFGDIFDMFFPREGSGEGFYKGNSLGSWDFKAQYNFKNNSRLSFYFEWPFEDGSGIGKMNGWDGLWGLQYNFKPGCHIATILFEYLDFTNQSGPIHYEPSDTPGTTITSNSTGGDNYYNNDFYGAYSNGGIAIGSSFLVAPYRNLDGNLEFAHNRARGFHIAASGNFGNWDYKAQFTYQHAGGTGRVPAHSLKSTSSMLELAWNLSELKGLALKAQVALDTGKLLGNNFGAIATISYSGSLTFGKK